MEAPLSPIDEEEPISPICQICNELYKEPKILPCSDRFCKSCLENNFDSTSEDNEFCCPTCKTMVLIPAGGISELPSAPPNSASTRGPSRHFTFDENNGIGTKGVSGVDTSFRPSLDMLRFSLANYRSSLDSLTKDSNKYLDTLKEACESTETLISKQAETLHRNIEDQKDKLIREMTQKREEEEISIKQHLSDLVATEKHMATTTEFMENVAACASEVKFSGMSITKQHTNQGNAALHLMIPSGEEHLKVNVSTDGNHAAKSLAVKDNHRSIMMHPHGGPHSRNGKKGVSFHVRDTKTTKTVPTRRKSKSYAIILARFKTDESVTGLATTVDDTIAVTTYSSKRCSIYTLEGKLMRDIYKGLIHPISVTSLVSGKLLVADAGDGTENMGLRLFYTDGEPFPSNLNISVAAWGMAEADHGDLVVCHPGKGKVCLYDRKGRMKMTLKSLDGKKLFANPRCVCVNINGDIIVSDFERHCIVFFDSRGNFKSSYGSEGKSTRQLHHPCGVCADRVGNVLIADSDNHRISLLSPDGIFIKFLLTHHDGLDEPVAVCLTKDDKLVVGEWSGKITVAKYDIAAKAQSK
ncbi:RING finger protein nhl-1 [Patella vulgata]|uniref:RING finger protein nhl-1 n=1 Tax=Patella vulgata TaxID=6465 RepID=UPI00217F97B8|nr:RING finger protein nhl-1 [Patella vulgata]